MAELGKKIKTSIGGQALMEGIMMRAPKKTVAVVRKPDGTLAYRDFTAEARHFLKIKKVPFVRGIFAMIDSFLLGYQTLNYSAEIATEGIEAESESKLDRWLEEKLGDKLMQVLMPIVLVIGLALAVLLFLWLPSFLFNLIFGTDGMNGIARSIFEGVFRLLILILYMVAISQMPEIHRVFEYHGAEHKTIFCYESGEELTIENVRKQKRFHPRCGTSFLVLMLLIGILIGFFIQTPNSFLRAGIRILLLPITCGIGYELIKFCGRHDHVLTRLIAAPGMWVQHITTKEPDDGMIEVAIEALKAVIPEDGEDILK